MSMWLPAALLGAALASQAAPPETPEPAPDGAVAAEVVPAAPTVAGDAPDTEAPAGADHPLEDDDDWLFEEDDDGPGAEPSPDDPAARDPFQPVNRTVFGFNELFFEWVADPISTAYEWAVPDPGRRAIRRFFVNLEQPVVFVNDVLQLSPVDAAETAGRFIVNSTVGIVGLFDPASRIGLEGHFTDFGETLAVYWAPPGPYVVIPVLGPATVRDALGEAVDGFLRLDIWLFGTGTQVLLTTGSGLATYDIERARLEALRETSVDFYSAMRGAYLLDRDAHVAARIERLPWRGGDEPDPPGPDGAPLP